MEREEGSEKEIKSHPAISMITRSQSEDPNVKPNSKQEPFL